MQRIPDWPGRWPLVSALRWTLIALVAFLEWADGAPTSPSTERACDATIPVNVADRTAPSDTVPGCERASRGPQSPVAATSSDGVASGCVIVHTD